MYLKMGYSRKIHDFSYKLWRGALIPKGVTLAQLVKAFVGQADVQRFEPHLGRNLLSVSCKVQALWAPSGTNHNGQIGNLS